DQASIDWVGTLPPAERRPLEERIASRSGLTQLDAMERLAMGVRRYRIESLG
ncbi:MAG TPA: (Fe-S)-binding protein, partial [Sutterella wadsworthensis]|nr:(Fe-S)-binding protein [Sutterella wadsworthensis]